MFPKANPETPGDAGAPDRARFQQPQESARGGHLFLAEQQFDQTAKVTIKALSIDPTRPKRTLTSRCFHAEASSHESADSARMAIDNAVTAIDQAIRLDPKLPEVWLFKE